MRRKASMQCRSAGAIGFLRLRLFTDSGHVREHEANDAKVKIVTDRYSGLEVEFVQAHKTYKKGERIIVGRNDFTTEISRIEAEIIALSALSDLSSIVVAGGKKRR